MTSHSDLTTSDQSHLRLVTDDQPRTVPVLLTPQQMYALRDAALNEIADIDSHTDQWTTPVGQWTSNMARRQQRMRTVLIASVTRLERTLATCGVSVDRTHP